MKPISLPILTYAVFVFQATLAPAVAIERVTPHFVLLALVPVVLHAGGRQGLMCAAAWGLLTDCLSAGCLGPGVVAFTGLAVVLQGIRRRSTLTSPVSVALLAMTLMGGCLAGMGALACWHARQPIDRSLFVQSVLVSGYSSAVLFGMLMLRRLLNPFLPAARSAPAATVANRWKMLTE